MRPKHRPKKKASSEANALCTALLRAINANREVSHRATPASVAVSELKPPPPTASVEATAVVQTASLEANAAIQTVSLEANAAEEDMDDGFIPVRRHPRKRICLSPPVLRQSTSSSQPTDSSSSQPTAASSSAPPRSRPSVKHIGIKLLIKPTPGGDLTRLSLKTLAEEINQAIPQYDCRFTSDGGIAITVPNQDMA